MSSSSPDPVSSSADSADAADLPGGAPADPPAAPGDAQATEQAADQADAAGAVSDGQSREAAQQASPAATAAKLAELFPALFKGAPKPLKLRIQVDIQERAPGVFSKQALSAFFRRYTGGTGYLIAVSKGSQRFDLDGQPAGELSDEHRKLAAEELARRRANANAKREQEEAGRRQRAALLRDFETTKLTTANFCALKGIVPDQLDGLLAQARAEALEEAQRPRRPEHGQGHGHPRRGEGQGQGRRDGAPGERRGGPRGEGRPGGPARGPRPGQDQRGPRPGAQARDDQPRGVPGGANREGKGRRDDKRPAASRQDEGGNARPEAAKDGTPPTQD